MVLVRGLVRMVGSLPIAEELIQDAYLKVSAALRDRPVEHLAPFLHQTARNLALDHLRSVRRRGTVVLPEHAVRNLDEIPVAVANPEASARDRQLLRRLDAALSRLPRRQQRIFVLSRLEGVTLGDIAALLGVSLSTVQKDLKAAMLACMTVHAELDRP
nr:RNA polymerase sigma factor [Plastoroseomonas hellenica]